MSLVYVGGLPLPLLCPQLNLCIGLPSIQFSADLSGALALNASLTITPPTVAIYLTALIDTELALALSIAPIPLPTVNFDLSVSLQIEASFNLSLSLLLNFSLNLSLSAFLSVHIGLYAFAYEGTGNAMGASLTSALASSWPDGSPTSGSCNALIFGATSSSAQQALEGFLNGLIFSPGLVGVTLGSIAALSPLTSKAEAQASAAITAKAQAQAMVSASLKAKGSVGFALPTVTLQALAKFEANLKADLSLAPPAIGVAVSASAKIAANIQASAGFMASFGAIFGLWSGELFVYTYSGPGTGLGAAVTSALASTWGDGHTPTSGECVATVLATTDSFSAGIVGAFFGGA